MGTIPLFTGPNDAGSLRDYLNQLTVAIDTVNNAIANIYIGPSTAISTPHTPGTNNMYIGIAAGESDPGNTLYLNLGIGNYTLQSNSLGNEQVAIGGLALHSYVGTANVIDGNTAVGVNSQGLNQTGVQNVSLGADTLAGLTVAIHNIGIGAGAGGSQDVGNDNIWIGAGAGAFGTTGRLSNIGIGSQTLLGQSAVSAYQKMTVIGGAAVNGASLASPLRGVVVGSAAVQGAAFAGNDVVVIGSDAGKAMTGNAHRNTVIGSSAGIGMTSGQDNIVIGYLAAQTRTTGGHSVIISTRQTDNNNSNEVNIEGILVISGTGTAATSLASFAGNLGIGQAGISSAILSILPGTTALAQINFGSTGVAPTSPNNGDFWFDGTNFKARVGGVTKTFTIA